MNTLTITIPARKVVVDVPYNMQLFVEIVQAIKNNKKINAIKLTRQATGYGLKEAKEYVEELEPKLEHGLMETIESDYPELFL